MEFRLLGPVEVRVGDRVLEAGPPQQRHVIAVLAADAGRSVTAETLIDRVWDEAPPPSARRTLHVYVTRIRRLLAQSCDGDLVSPRLVRRSGGYVLDADPSTVDVHRFRSLVDRARDPAVGDLDRVELLHEAVGLWRAEPLAGVPGAWAERMRYAWRQEYLNAAVSWADAELRCGNSTAVIGRLTELSGEYRLDESLTAVLMRALYAAGRAGDALQRYVAARRWLAEELGVDPGVELQRLHQAILRNEVVCAPAGSSVPGRVDPAAGLAPAMLPMDVRGFTGRADELAYLFRLLTGTVGQPTAMTLCVVWGTAGVGKTALAVHWAHRVRHRFPDGQLYLNLRGFHPRDSVMTVAEAIRRFLDALNVATQRIPATVDAQIALYRTLLADRQMLVLLDNVRDAEQVRPLLPGAPGCLVLVTSRYQMPGLVAADGAHPLALDLLRADEAHDLLRRRVGADRVAAEADGAAAVVGFGELVRAARYDARMTQEQLAETSGVSVRTVVELERGQVRRPRADTVRRIAEACGLTGPALSRFEAAAQDGYWRERERASGVDAPAHLPPDVVGFTGRTRELAELDAALARAAATPTATVVVALSGTAGVGKTALAIHWAHRVAGLFPDGQLYANLRGFDPARPARAPDDVVREFLDGFGVPPHRIPAEPEARTGRYRSLLAGRRVLVLLDNARDANQVRPLLPGTGSALVVVTSRDPLTGLVAAEAAQPTPVGLLDPAQARELLAARLGPDRLAAEPSAVEQIVARCAGLPLALAVAAARAATGAGLHALAAEFRDTPNSLGPLAGADPATDVRAVFTSSYLALHDRGARMFRLLGLHPGTDVSEPAAASLAGAPGAEARPLLAELVRAYLVTGNRPGRYAMHDLLRAYAAELVPADPDAGAAQLRLLDHYLHTAHAADRLIIPARYPIPLDPPQPGVTPAPLTDRADALAWFAAERPTLVAAVRVAADAGHYRHAWQLAWTTLEYLNRWGHWADAAASHEVALAAAERLHDPRALAFTHRGLGRAYGLLGRLDDAHTHLLRAVELFEQVDAPAGAARTLLSLAGLAERRGHHHDALRHAEHAWRLFRAAEQPVGVGNALNTMAWYHSLLGDADTALALGRQALAVLQPLGDTFGLASTWQDLGTVHHDRGDHAEAVDCHRQAVQLHRVNNDRHSEADALDHLGHAYQALGDPSAARDAHAQAADIRAGLDHP